MMDGMTASNIILGPAHVYEAKLLWSMQGHDEGVPSFRTGNSDTRITVKLPEIAHA